VNIHAMDTRVVVFLGILTIVVCLITPDETIRQTGIAFLSIVGIVFAGRMLYLIIARTKQIKKNLRQAFYADEIDT
jgi:hypothetical protein